MSEYSNIFIIINLGSEMLYVIDQRLKAQEIAADKSTQVLRDIIGVLLNPKLLHQLATQKTRQSTKNAYTLLADIACSSIMRLDSHSMSKLWDLMTMVFKWQLTLSNEQQLIDITCKHLTGVTKLLPQEDIVNLTTYANDYVCKIWSKLSHKEIHELHYELILFLQYFKIKVSLLLRLNLQNNDASFVSNPCKEKYGNMLRNLGENIYIKYNHVNQPSSEVKVKDIITPNADCNDLKLLASELIGDNKCMENRPAIILNFDGIKEELARANDVQHSFVNKSVDMENLHLIYQDLTVDDKTYENRTLQEQLLDLLQSNED